MGGSIMPAKKYDHIKIIKMHVDKGMSTYQIAKELEMTPNSVRVIFPVSLKTK